MADDPFADLMTDFDPNSIKPLESPKEEEATESKDETGTDQTDAPASVGNAAVAVVVDEDEAEAVTEVKPRPEPEPEPGPGDELRGDPDDIAGEVTAKGDETPEIDQKDALEAVYDTKDTEVREVSQGTDAAPGSGSDTSPEQEIGVTESNGAHVSDEALPAEAAEDEEPERPPEAPSDIDANAFAAPEPEADVAEMTRPATQDSSEAQEEAETAQIAREGKTREEEEREEEKRAEMARLETTVSQLRKELSQHQSALSVAKQSRDAAIREKEERIAELNSRFTSISRRQKEFYNESERKRQAAVAKAKKYKQMATQLNAKASHLSKSVNEEKQRSEAMGKRLERLRAEKSASDTEFQKTIELLKGSLNSVQANKEAIAEEMKVAQEALDKLIVVSELKSRMRCHIELGKNSLSSKDKSFTPTNLTMCRLVMPFYEGDGKEDDVESAFEIQWFRSHNAEMIKIDGATSSEYQLCADDIGSVVKVLVVSRINADCREHSTVGPVTINKKCLDKVNENLTRILKNPIEFIVKPNLKDSTTAGTVGPHVGNTKQLIIHLNRDKVKLRNDRKQSLKKESYSVSGIRMKMFPRNTAKFMLRLTKKEATLQFYAQNDIERDLIALTLRAYCRKLQSVQDPRVTVAYFVRAANEVANDEDVGTESVDDAVFSGEKLLSKMLQPYSARHRNSLSGTVSSIGSPMLKGMDPELSVSGLSNTSLLDEPSGGALAEHVFPTFEEQPPDTQEPTLAKKGSSVPSAVVTPLPQSNTLEPLTDSGMESSRAEEDDEDREAEEKKAWANLEFIAEDKVKTASASDIAKVGIALAPGGKSKPRHKGKDRKRAKPKGRVKRRNDAETNVSGVETPETESPVRISLTPRAKESEESKENPRELNVSVQITDKVDCVMKAGKLVKIQLVGNVVLSFEPTLSQETRLAFRVTNLQRTVTKLFGPAVSVQDDGSILVTCPEHCGNLEIIKYVWKVENALMACPFKMMTRKETGESKATLSCKVQLNPHFADKDILDFVVKADCQPEDAINDCTSHEPSDAESCEYHWSKEMPNKAMWKLNAFLGKEKSKDLVLKASFGITRPVSEFAVKCMFHIADCGVADVSVIDCPEVNAKEGLVIRGMEHTRTLKSGKIAVQ